MSVLARYGASAGDIAGLLSGWGEPRYRAAQVWDGLYRRRAPLEDLSDLPKGLRQRLATALPLALEVGVTRQGDGGDTVKWLWSAGGAQVETVLMRYPERATVCVSSQAGCAMGCTFCATGQAGFERHLDAGEITEQVARAQHACPQRVSGVVFMGMGEPLANFDATWEAVVRLHDDFGISARSLTVSTVGVVPGMRRLAEAGLPVTLAVSLHAPDDDLRNQLVPLNRRYPLAEVLDAARHYLARRGRRLSFEYAMIGGVNDRLDQADRLARRLGGFAPAAHVNLIPLNPTDGYPGPASPAETVASFAQRLRERGVPATVRRNRGTTIDAACGQLRSRHSPDRLTARP
ncbi:MAG: 23S rRNA (adenine(2503)-C(2))-methyltransferase RlmN [Acidimicrobiia bacterium]